MQSQILYLLVLNHLEWLKRLHIVCLLLSIHHSLVLPTYHCFTLSALILHSETLDGMC
jgi:hypothetical protein